MIKSQSFNQDQSLKFLIRNFLYCLKYIIWNGMQVFYLFYLFEKERKYIMIKKKLLLLSLVSIIILAILITGNVFAGDTIVKEFKGSNVHTTRPFTVQDEWEVQWDYIGTGNKIGDIFQIFLDGEENRILIANQINTGKGSSYQAKGGKYHLIINATGKWKINIVQIK